jgi:hypothetical protein
MKKPLRLFAFVFFLFAIYLNVFYKEDSFLARMTSGKSQATKSENTAPAAEGTKAPEASIAEVQSK